MGTSGGTSVPTPGADNTVLTADAAQTAKMKWAASASHTHDGTGGTTSTVLGGTAEAGANVPVASTGQAIAIGDFANAGTSVNPIAIGSGTNATTAASATGQSAVAIGACGGTAAGARAAGNGATAIGGATSASGGAGASAAGSSSVAIGGSHVAGGGAIASATDSIAIGRASSATQTWNIAIGSACVASGSDSIGLGHGVASTGADSIAIGTGANAAHTNATALGNSVATTNANQLNIGAYRLFMGGPNSVPADADLINSQISFYLDEAGNNLKVKVKYAAGTVKIGTLAVA